MDKLQHGCLIVVCMLSLGTTIITHAEEAPLTVVQPAIDGHDYDRLRNLYRQGQHEEAIAEAKLYLTVHPLDGDVRFLLGTFYAHDKDYAKAQHELSAVLQQNPNYFDARPILINVDIALGQYQEAADIAEAGLVLHPGDKVLLKKKTDIASIVNAKKTVTKSKPHTKKHKKRPSKISHHKRVNSIRNAPEKTEKKYLNEVGVYQQNYYLSDVHQTWNYSTVYYGHETGIGKVYGKLSYNNRLFRQGLQEEIEAYPILNKYLYFDLDFAIAHDPNLFPDRRYAAEGYLQAGKTLGLSFGARYNNVDSRHHFTVLTGSVTKNHQQDQFTFRPYHYVPGSGDDSTLYTLDFRHMMSEPFYYIGCIVGAGTSPDLANLTTINFIVLKNKLVNPYINFPLLNDQLIANIGVLFQNQIFPSDRVRNWYGGTLGLAWKY